MVPLAIAALTTGVLVSPSARTHAHDAHAGHTEAVASVASPSAARATEAGRAQPSDRAATGVAVTHDHAPLMAEVAADASADDKGLSLVMNGMQHERVVTEMDGATTALLAHQLARTAELVGLYPTVADAEAAGYRRQGPFAPGLGTHYGKGGDTIIG